jgi:hypothetical protein
MGGVNTTGGAMTGGEHATGSTATGGAATGGTATGGVKATGGAATGGTKATGGAATGGAKATGGAATGGAATGGAATGGTASAFKGGPCVVSTNGTSIEVFARGSDKKIYRKTVAGTTQGKWANVSDLDASLIDNRSDLDCSATITNVHIVALGVSPVGAVLYASGSGTSYNPFARQFSTETFSPSPSVTALTAAFANDFRIATYQGSLIKIGEVASGTYSDFGVIPETATFNSSPDIAFLASSSANYTLMVAFDTSNQLTLQQYSIGSGGASWLNPPLQLAAPTSTLYQYTPSICVDGGQATGTTSNMYLATVAGDRLWTSYNTGSLSLPFSGWLQSGAEAASAPDCVLTYGDTVMHVVTLSNTGSVLLYEGKGGGPFTKTDLGTY